MRFHVAIVIACACSHRRHEAPPLAFSEDACRGARLEVDIKRAASCAKVGQGDQAQTIAVVVEGTDLLVGGALHDGGKLVVGSASAEASSGNALVRVPIADELAKVAVADYEAGKPVDFHKQLVVTLAHYEDATVAVPPVPVTGAIVDLFANADRGPIRLGAEPAGAPAAHSAVLASIDGAHVIGPAKTLADIDWVAVRAEHGTQYIKSCRYTNGTLIKDVKLVGVIETVTIYERKTRTVIDKRDFTGAGDCPERPGSGDEQRVPIDLAPVAAWLHEKVGA